MNIISSIKNYLSPNQDISMNNSVDNTINDVIIDTTFKLPIEYLDNNDIKTLPTHVSNDLELILTPEPDDKNMYEHLFNPTNCLLYTSPSPRDATLSRMPSSA